MLSEIFNKLFKVFLERRNISLSEMEKANQNIISHYISSKLLVNGTVIDVTKDFIILKAKKITRITYKPSEGPEERIELNLCFFLFYKEIGKFRPKEFYIDKCILGEGIIKAIKCTDIGSFFSLNIYIDCDRVDNTSLDSTTLKDLELHEYHDPYYTHREQRRQELEIKNRQLDRKDNITAVLVFGLLVICAGIISEYLGYNFFDGVKHFFIGLGIILVVGYLLLFK